MKTFSHRQGSSRRPFVRAMLLVTTVVALFATQALMPTPSSAQSPYGILLNEIDHTTPRAEIASRMAMARQANASWIRLDFYWYSVEWTRGAFNWTYFDTLVQEANAHGLSIVGTMGWPARWAVTDGVAYYGVPDMAAWENFVSRTAARYRGQVDIWEIWNEPDKPYYWRGTPGKYAELLARAHTKIKAADPGADVAVGGLAQGGTSLVGDFLQQILSNGTYPAGRYYDVHNIHTNYRTPSLITSQVNTNRAILSQHGLSKPIIATEASYSSDPGYQTLPGYTGGGEATQARYLVDIYRSMLANGISVAIWATGVDYDDGSGEYALSGLTHNDLRPKQAFTAFRNLAASTAAPPAPPPPPSSNQAPISRPGGPYTGAAGQQIQFNGAGSSDPDGGIQTYRWYFGDGSTATGANPAYRYPRAGTYRVFLNVTDNRGVTTAASTTATIGSSSGGGQLPTSRPGGAYSGRAGQVIQFNGTGSSDPGGSIRTYEWYFGDGGTATGPTPTHRYTRSGTYRVFLVVTDSSGNKVAGNTTSTIAP